MVTRVIQVKRVHYDKESFNVTNSSNEETIDADQFGQKVDIIPEEKLDFSTMMKSDGTKDKEWMWLKVFLKKLEFRTVIY